MVQKEVPWRCLIADKKDSKLLYEEFVVRARNKHDAIVILNRRFYLKPFQKWVISSKKETS